MSAAHPRLFFLVLRRIGPEWDASKPMEEQTGWPEHAAFMEGLVESGGLLLGGPLADEERVVLVFQAASGDDVRALLARDPWSGTHLVLDSVDAWTIRLDGRTARR